MTHFFHTKLEASRRTFCPSEGHDWQESKAGAVVLPWLRYKVTVQVKHMKVVSVEVRTSWKCSIPSGDDRQQCEEPPHQNQHRGGKQTQFAFCTSVVQLEFSICERWETAECSLSVSMKSVLVSFSIENLSGYTGEKRLSTRSAASYTNSTKGQGKRLWDLDEKYLLFSLSSAFGNHTQTSKFCSNTFSL